MQCHFHSTLSVHENDRETPNSKVAEKISSLDWRSGMHVKTQLRAAIYANNLPHCPFKITRKWEYIFLIDIDALCTTKKFHFQRKMPQSFCPNFVMLPIGFSEKVWFKCDPQYGGLTNNRTSFVVRIS